MRDFWIDALLWVNGVGIVIWAFLVMLTISLLVGAFIADKFGRR